MPYYFAYGSNMAPRQMAARCPGARPVGPATLPGWRFIITTRGTANIVNDASHKVHGVLWRCEPRHMTALDRWEGVSWRNYRRRSIIVTLADGRTCTALSYVSSRTYCGPARADYLLSAVLPGARCFDLPADFVNELESWLPRKTIAGTGSRYARRYVGSR